MRTVSVLSVFFFLLLASLSCVKIETLPPEPRIEYRSFTVFDTIILDNDTKGGKLKFYFEDGDGDLGLNAPGNEENNDSINLFLTLYRKNNGIMSLAPDDDPLKPAGYRIPYMERLGQNKILKGTISATFYYLFFSENDTIKYDFYIKDRAENISNIASTGEIVISENGIY